MRGILLISENRAESVTIKGALEKDGHVVACASSDEESIITAAENISPEIVVIDCPNNSECISSARRILKTECKLKEFHTIAVISPQQAKHMEWAGIDDFVFHPVNVEELSARIDLIRWRTRSINGDNLIKADGLLIDTSNYNVSIDGMPVELTFKEYELLKFLATHKGRVFTRESLLDHVWGYDYYGGTRTVDVHIRRLRAKLGESSESLIETVRNVGYRFSG